MEDKTNRLSKRSAGLKRSERPAFLDTLEAAIGFPAAKTLPGTGSVRDSAFSGICRRHGPLPPRSPAVRSYHHRRQYHLTKNLRAAQEAAATFRITSRRSWAGAAATEASIHQRRAPQHRRQHEKGGPTPLGRATRGRRPPPPEPRRPRPGRAAISHGGNTTISVLRRPRAGRCSACVVFRRPPSFMIVFSRCFYALGAMGCVSWTGRRGSCRQRGASELQLRRRN